MSNSKHDSAKKVNQTSLSRSKLEVAQLAASSLFEDTIEVKFVETLKTGEDVFTANRRDKKGTVTITLNPNGTKAAVEWKGSRNKQSTDYKIFRVDGIPTSDDLSDTDGDLPVADNTG